MEDDHQILHLPPGISIEDIKGGGTSGLVARLPGTQMVIKFSLGSEDETARCLVEVSVYERFAKSKYRRPNSILEYYGTTESGILLEYAENGTVRQHLQNLKVCPTEIVLRWARQLIRALIFSHQNSVLHGDLSCANLFLGRSLDLKLGDFAGSSIDGSPAMVAYSSSHTLPNPRGLANTDQGIAINVQTEIFAVGSVLYEMVTGHPPYIALSAAEIEKQYRLGKFPSTTSYSLGQVISNCWNLRYQNMSDVLRDIDDTGPCASPSLSF